MDFDYNQFQKEVHEWSIYNFGEGRATQKLCGIIEELYELRESITNTKYMEDAIGDTLIYMADFAAILNIPFQDITVQTTIFGSDILYDNALVVLGELCHSTLKWEQKIRTNEDHLKNIRNSLRIIFFNLRKVCLGYELKNIDKIVEETWNVVKQRDWKKNAEKGVV